LRKGLPFRGEAAHRRKEIEFWGVGSRYAKGFSWYLQHFPACENEDPAARAIDASPGYLHYEHAPAQLARAYSGAAAESVRLVVLLREPVSRAISWIRFLQRGAGHSLSPGAPPLCGYNVGSISLVPGCGRFLSCLGGVEGSLRELLSEPGRAHALLDADARGLANWLKAFPRTQIFVATNEELDQNDGAPLAALVERWIGVPPLKLGSLRLNAAASGLTTKANLSAAVLRQVSRLSIPSIDATLKLLVLHRLGRRATVQYVESWLDHARTSGI
jgi:hypothetical protein